MRIVLLGRADARDFGEEAVLSAVVHALRARLPGGAPTLLSFAPDVHRRLGVDVVDATDLAASTAAVTAADLVVVVGNAVWMDTPGWTADAIFEAPRPVPLACVARPLLTAAAHGVPVAWLANGIAPLRDAGARRTVAFLASLATQVSVRDDDGAEALRAAGFAGGVAITADPIFAVVPDAAAPVPARRRPLRIGVVSAARDDPALRALAGAMCALATRSDVELLLLAPTGGRDGDDATVTRLRAQLALATDAVQIAPAATGEAAAGWLAACDAVVTTEMHGAVLAAVAGTPAVVLASTSALRRQAAFLGLADLAVRADACTAEAIARHVERVLASRAAIAAQLAARVEVARTLLDAGYEALPALAASSGDARAPTADEAQALANERICARLRSRLEQREESWRTLASFLGHDVETVAPVSTGPQRSRDIEVLKGRAEAAEAELEAIKRSRGWRALQGWGRFKHRYVLPIVRAVGRRRRRRDQPPSGEEPAPAVVPPGTYDVVCFPIIDWDFRFQRPQQLMSRFAAAGHRVFYVAPRFGAAGSAPVVVERARNLYDVVLSGTARNPWTEALDPKDAEQVFASLNQLRTAHALGATLACVQLPFWWPVAALARERLAWPVLYDCMDHHAGFSTFTGTTSAHEDELFARADLVVASSDVLAARARRHRRDVAVVRNGCDFDHFTAAGATPRVPGPRPTVGFYGAIADWFDADLVADLAARRPDWDFVLVGSTDTGDVSRLAALPNVRLPGERPYAELPRWLAGFDVTLLPFARTPLTEAANPVKAYEILAAGKPIVSVPLPEMAAFRGLVYLAETSEEFERAIEAALAPADAGRAEARRAFARANTWDARYRDLAALVPPLFPKASTIIVTYGDLATNRACLESVAARTEWPCHEIIVVDNASNDDTRAYLERLADARPDLILIANDANRGFAAACNQGLARATGDYLVLLNNDTVVTRGWLSTLARHLHAVPEIGLIGPVTNEIGNEAKVPVGYTDVAAMPAWAAGFVRAHDDELRSMPMLAMFCVAMRREAFVEVGPLDERFAIGMFEDDDYARRMQAKGYRVVCASDAFVHHVGGASFKRLDPERYRALFERNKRAYERKWGAWTPHEDHGAPARAARLRERLDRIVAAAGVSPRAVVVFLRFLSEPSPSTTRAERFAAALAARGMLVFVHGPSDAADGFRALAPGLWEYCGPSGTLERLTHPIVWALPYNARDAFRWLARAIVYDVGDPPASLPCEETLLRANHERMLREADLVVCGSRALLQEVAAARPDAVCVPNAAAAPGASWDDRAAAVIMALGARGAPAVGPTSGPPPARADAHARG